MEPVFREFTVDYPFTNLFVRGDSGYAAPELYMACEKYGAQYAIRLKANQVLYKKHLWVHYKISMESNAASPRKSFGFISGCA